jgi:restriction endonuclease S subunit
MAAYRQNQLYILRLSSYIQNLFEIEKQKAPGGIIKTITKEVLSDFKVELPEYPEQQKIANCLSSIDDLLTAQTQKIDTLKSQGYFILNSRLSVLRLKLALRWA